MQKLSYLLASLFAAGIIFTACGNRQSTANNEAVTETTDEAAAITQATPPAVVSICNQTDEGVFIAGARWATRNVGAPGTFAANPEDAGMLFQWNRRTGWSSTDPLVNSDGGTAWNTTAPAGTAWYSENDPCPPGWRVPTGRELSALRNSGDFGWLSNDWVSRNGVYGRVFGNAPNQIFIPAAGYRSGRTGNLSRANTSGYYWGSTQADNEQAYDMWFGSGRIDNSISPRTAGFSVRCVKK